MKKNIIIPILFASTCVAIVSSGFVLKTSGMHPSTTGAPGEWTCADAQSGCHNDATVTNDNTGIVNTLTYSAADSSYVPGQTYTLTLKAQKSGISKFGFGILALRVNNNGNAGTWVITDAARTHTVTGTGTLSTRKYVTHSSNGTPALSPGMNQWSFNWTAPLTNQGNITFYYATNCTNNNGKETGDQIYLSNFTIHPFVGTSVYEWVSEAGMNAFYDAANNSIAIDYHLLKEGEFNFSVYDLAGKQLLETAAETRFSGKNSEHLNLPSSLSKGIYMVNLHVNDQILTQKLLIQ